MCGKEEDSPKQKVVPLVVSVNTEITYQTIAGFGGANRMWGTSFLKPAEATKAFATDEAGLGLSIFRVRIASDDNEWPLILESVKEAQKYDVKILASPWSPPADLKSNGTDIGGHLPSENFEAFKDHINSFIEYMSSNGVGIYSVSIQNEPDIQVSYESCDWLAPDMINFLENYGDLIQGAKVAAPESFNFNSAYTNALLLDAEAAANVDIIAGHIYGSGLGTFPLAEQQGKEIWMTEYLLNLGTGNAGAPAWTTYSETEKWEESLQMLHTVQEAMTKNWSAYIWWYLQRYYSFIGDGEQGTSFGAILKRGWAFSHFSKYVRPGYVRVDVSTSRTTSLEITAYESNEQIVIVVLNRNEISVGGVNFEVPAMTSASARVTNLESNRVEKTIEVSGNKVIVNVSPKSITTIVVEK
jgi:O-glycosyl hydrolase